MPQATESRFSMLRGIVALACADGQISREEREQIETYIDNNAELSAEQRRTLRADLGSKIGVNDVWDKITDPQDRAHLINIAENIFLKDGTYSAAEKASYDRIYSQHRATLDMSAIVEDMRSTLAKQRAEDAVYAGRSGKVGQAFAYLHKKFG